MINMVLRDLQLTTVELQLIVKIIQFLLDVCWTRTVLAHAEGQQHVDLKYGNRQADTNMHEQCLVMPPFFSFKSNLNTM